MKKNKTKVARSLLLSCSMVVGTGFVLNFAPGNADAVSVVEVGPNLAQSMMNQINTFKTQISASLAQGEAAREYTENASRWMSTLNNWSQKLAKYQQVLTGMSFQRNIPIERIPEDFNIEEKCGGGGGFSLSQLAGTIVTKMTAATNIREQRYNLCAAIQYLQNKKHNDTVDMLKTSLPEMQNVLSGITNIRTVLSEGTMSESTNNSVQSANRINVAFEQYEQENKLLDQYIVALQRQQQELTARALRGERKDSLTGFIVDAATIKIALDPEKKETDQ